MEFPNCKVKAVKANIASGELTLTFTAALNDDSLEEAEALALYVDKKDGKVELSIIPQQPQLFDNLGEERPSEEEIAETAFEGENEE